MIHRKIIRHLAPHIHSNGKIHRAHALSLLSLFIYLQIFLLTSGGFYFIRQFAPHILGTASFGASQIVELTNTKRAEKNLPSLSANGQLASAASAKARDMFANNYWAHNSPSGKTPWSFIGSAGYKYIFAGENLARDFGDPGSVVNAWMNSPSHRSNLLDGNFKEIGVAVESGKLEGREGILVVQMFGSRISQTPSQQLAVASPKPESSPPANTSPTPAVAKTGISPTPVPSPTPLVEPTPITIVQLNEPVTGNQQPATVLASRQFSIAKGASFFIIGIIFALFATEMVVATRRTDIRVRPGVIAHLALLGFVLLALWYAVGGAIL